MRKTSLQTTEKEEKSSSADEKASPLGRRDQIRDILFRINGFRDRIIREIEKHPSLSGAFNVSTGRFSFEGNEDQLETFRKERIQPFAPHVRGITPYKEGRDNGVRVTLGPGR